MKNLYLVLLLIQLVMVIAFFVFHLMYWRSRFNKIKCELEIAKMISSVVVCVIQIPKIYIEIILERTWPSVAFSVIVFAMYGWMFLTNLRTVWDTYKKKNFWKGYMFDREDEQIEER